MQVKDIIEKLNLEVFGGNTEPEKEITGGYVSDLLSDVMGYSSEGNVWITLQTHKNVLAIASLKELAAVILVKGLKPSEETLEHANEEGIALLGTHKSTFEITGELYKLIS
ncbi:MAG: serine kinase [Salinivirgaceae bacterium]|nr:MAG: serine kinase [Salinivirgaceae bacterium]